MPRSMPFGGDLRGNKCGGAFIRIIFLVYVAVMLWLLFGQRIGEEGITVYFGISSDNLNLMPLKTVRLYLWLLQNSTNEALLRHAVINLMGNVVLFVPLGWFLPRIWARLRCFFKTVLAVILLISAVEVVQYFTRLGSCDIDDLILNLFGAVAGYCMWKIGTYRQSRK